MEREGCPRIGHEYPRSRSLGLGCGDNRVRQVFSALFYPYFSIGLAARAMEYDRLRNPPFWSCFYGF